MSRNPKHIDTEQNARISEDQRKEKADITRSSLGPNVKCISISSGKLLLKLPCMFSKACLSMVSDILSMLVKHATVSLGKVKIRASDVEVGPYVHC